MKTVKFTVIFVLLVVCFYLSLTWFFFGSPHPCGILEARQRPWFTRRLLNIHSRVAELRRQIAAASRPSDQLLEKLKRRTISQEERNSLEQQLDKFDSDLEAYNKAKKDYEDTLSKVAELVHQSVWRLTPAQCLWEAITWREPPPEDLPKQGASSNPFLGAFEPQTR
jgi:septal ring factor EnvC (AmiA/AmiB activator)